MLLFFITNKSKDIVMFYWIKTSKLIKYLYRKFIWDLPNNDKKIYLTFDDGPIPEVTEWVLAILDEYNIKATFFCIGNNITKNKTIFHKIIQQGHAIGNHTQNHVNGWKSDFFTYINEIEQCKTAMQNEKFETTLFRPPYGKIKDSQADFIIKNGGKIIMWDVLSADFDNTITKEQCLKNVIKNTTSGSIIVFHDSIKAYPNLKYSLPKAIEHFKKQGYFFDTIS